MRQTNNRIIVNDLHDNIKRIFTCAGCNSCKSINHEMNIQLNSKMHLNPIVLDNGSGTIKAGFSGCAHPSTVFSNVIGRAHLAIPSEISFKKEYIGNEAIKYKTNLSIHYPVEHGIVTNWDDMEKIWHYIFCNELHVTPEEHPILLTEAPLNPMANRQKMAQTLFEHFKAPAIFIANQAVLTFYSIGRIAGIILEIGDGITYILPVSQGFLIPHVANRLDFAGRDLTNWMTRLLTERGYSFTTTAEREIIRNVKEKCSYVAYDYEQELDAVRKNKSDVETVYELPDGQRLTIGNERFRCAEALFTPSIVGQQIPGIAELVYNTIMNCDLDIRDRLYRKIVLSGGTTFIPGLAKRLHKELKILSPHTMKIRIFAEPERNFSAWIGGSILSSLSSFERMWISKQEYDEYGPSIVHRKCM